MTDASHVAQEPEIAIFQATDTGEEPTGAQDDASTYKGWRVIKSSSHALGKWQTSNESAVDPADEWTSGTEAMQQMIAAGQWTARDYREPPGNAKIFTVGPHTTKWHLEEIIQVHNNGYRVGVLVPSDPDVRARMRALFDAGVPTIDIETVNAYTGSYEPVEALALESLIIDLAFTQ